MAINREEILNTKTVAEFLAVVLAQHRARPLLILNLVE